MPMTIESAVCPKSVVSSSTCRTNGKEKLSHTANVFKRLAFQTVVTQ